MRLPNAAVRYDSFGAYVYKLEQAPDGKLRARRQPIELGSHHDKELIVLSGLQANDQVATVGSFKLSAGMLVNLADDAATGSQ